MSVAAVMAFLAMGGYGVYVWGSWLMVLTWVLAEAVWVARGHRQALRAALQPPEAEE
ncbi:MAG: heme exporter protein CcmD [Rhodoferax sp.]|nr:heme exporter protein CcmD [Rhodoferax sp.]